MQIKGPQSCRCSLNHQASRQPSCSIPFRQRRQQQQQQRQLPQRVSTASTQQPASLAARPAAAGRVRASSATHSAAETSSNEHQQEQQQQQEGPDLSAWRVQDVIHGVTVDGKDVFLEVIAAPAAAAPAAAAGGSGSSSDSSTAAAAVQLAHQGVLYAPEPAAPGSSGACCLQLRPLGWQLHQQHDLVRALPGWAAALAQQQGQQRLPTQPLQLQSASIAYSAAQLQAAVKANPAPWTDGTGPLDSPLVGLQYQMLCAGELEALLAGARGVAALQLVVGWDAGAPQPVANPLVLHSLRRALGNRGISIFMSPAPGGLGLTAILSAKAEPFRSWAAHLASFGAQAALVADSPYYKLLIGRVLGYKEDNIRYHIQATSGRQHPTQEVVAAVDKDLAKLSKKKPVLPWTADSSAAGGGSSGRQRQQQQQQARSARKRR